MTFFVLDVIINIVIEKKKECDILSLTIKQEAGRKLAIERYKNGERYTTIGGLAGSGKTYLSKIIIESLGVKESEYLVGAFTGKAALRLQENGFPHAKTLHKLFYNSIKIPGSDDFIHIPVESSAFRDFKVILIDEVSMVPDNMLRVIARTGLHVINIGDPFQLPPIGKDNGMLSKPHIFLDEIVRQEAGNSIIRLAHAIRNGDSIKPFSDEYVKMINKKDMTTGMLTWADQVLCGKNATRNELNQVIRSELGFTGNIPKAGEKVIFTQNNWDFISIDGNPLINGLIGTVTRAGDSIKDSRGGVINKTSIYGYMNFVPDFGGSEFTNVKYDALPFISGEDSFIFDQNAKGNQKINKADFGYVITTHKAQGSEYKKCLGIEERMRGTNHARWLYTMVTRAKEQLVLLYDDNNNIWR